MRDLAPSLLRQYSDLTEKKGMNYTPCTMISKHIYLTEELDRQVHRVALTEKKPAAQVIREKLHAGFAATPPARNGGDALLALAGMAGKCDDPFLSRNIDKYLYETP